jgi:GTPase Era involved in 16S rRNA processing
MIHAVLVSLRQHTTMNHNIDLVIHHLEENARSFSEHYLAQVFVPAVRYAVSHFIRTQFRAVTKDNLPASVRVRHTTLTYAKGGEHSCLPLVFC